LKNIKDDRRTIDNLFNGINNTYNDNNMWLAPFIKANNEKDAKYTVKNNTIFISFEKPIVISCMNFWNYSKTPKRGAKEIEIHLDEILIFKVLRINIYLK
jgi:protein JBTS26